jgi:hypothetical protein
MRLRYAMSRLPCQAHPPRVAASLASLQRVWRHATTGGVPRRALGVTIVVGTLLNLINQGDALFGGAPIGWLKLCLTYAIPYCVATYGAVTAKMAAESAAPPTGHVDRAGRTVVSSPRTEG